MKILGAHAYKVIEHVGHGVLINKKITSTHNKTLIFYFFKMKGRSHLIDWELCQDRSSLVKKGTSDRGRGLGVVLVCAYYFSVCFAICLG